MSSGSRTLGHPSTTGPAEVRLRHSQDDRPGISRRRVGRGFSYRDADGQRIADDATLGRIRALAIPPAWTDVWICPEADGHLQATGRDARGRKQHRYHPLWLRRQDRHKFGRMAAFARALPKIRRRCDADLSRRGLPRDKVLAAVVRLLELTLIRVGNEEYARLNRSFGLTTLRDRHAQIDGAQITFKFRGKSGQRHEVGLHDRRLATVVRRCQDLPGQELFQYVDDDGLVCSVGSHDVNDYLRRASGGPFTAKDFRTWAGTVLAYRALQSMPVPDAPGPVRRNVAAAMRTTADRLGNSPAVARASYVHPAVIDAYVDGQVGRTSHAAQDMDDVALTSVATRSETNAILDLLGRRSRPHRRGCRGTAEGARSTRSGRSRQGESER